MEPRSLTYIAEAMRGELHGAPDLMARRVCSDSRALQAGDVFFAVAGEKFDGHDFVAEAARKQALAVVVASGRVEGLKAALSGVAWIAVDDTRLALGRLAARYRRDFDVPVVAVAGSNGKTTTKELAASVLGQRFKTLKNEASFNNDIGVPLTLLNLEHSHQAAVLEAGTNHPGELAPLLDMIQPKYGLLTGIGREHLEFFGDLAGVAREEGSLGEALPADGKLFLSGDNEWVGNLRGRCRAPVVTLGLGGTNDWRAADLRLDERGVAFQVTSPKAGVGGACRVNLLGRHQAGNALLALAVGAELGLTWPELCAGLAACRPPKMRMQMREAAGVRFLDDCYNANADSMRAALQALADMPCTQRRIAVLGDMAELGEHAPEAHREAGQLAAELGVGWLVVVGQWAGETAAAARRAGLAAATECADVAAAAGELRGRLQAGDLVLVKASRSARLERLFELLAPGNN